MATKSAALATTQSQVPAVSEEELEFLRQHKAQGISTASEDNLLPFIRVLQVASRQCNRTSGFYINGAEGGAFLLSSAPEPIIKGEEGFYFQPCYYYKDFAEWTPRDSGGGLVAMHTKLPTNVTEVVDDRQKQKVKWVTQGGTEINERKNYIGYVILPSGQTMMYDIPFQGSGHSIARSWMTTMQARMINGIVPPMYAQLFHLTTRQRTNAKGTWFVINIEYAKDHPLLTPSGMLNKEARERGLAFHERCIAEDLRAQAPDRDEPVEAEPAAF